MQFELQLSKEQKKNVAEQIVNRNNRLIGCFLVLEVLLNIMPLGLITAGLLSGELYMIPVGLAMKLLVFPIIMWFMGKLNIHKAHAEAYGYRCTIIDIDSIELEEGAKRSDLTGQKGIKFLFTEGYVQYEIDGSKRTARNEDIVLDKTATLVREGNREHMAVLYGAGDNILVAASLIDKRYENLTIEELKDIADLAAKEGIDNIDIDDVINNTSFKKALSKGEAIDKKDKRRLVGKIWKQFYVDYEGRSLMEEITRRATKYIALLAGYIAIISYLMSNIEKQYFFVFKEYPDVYNYIFYGVSIIFGIDLVIYGGYVFFRNDICKWLSRTKEPRILYATIEYEGEEKKENAEHFKYKLITEYGDVIHNVYSRDDMYIHHRAQYGEVMVLVCDKMLAVYPKGYLDV